VAQYVAALDMGHSYLGKGFGALLATPLGAGAHLLALSLLLGGLLVHFLSRATLRVSWRE
jgi:hypothetical protein